MRNCPSQLIYEPTSAKRKTTFHYLIEIETVDSTPFIPILSPVLQIRLVAPRNAVVPMYPNLYFSNGWGIDRLHANRPLNSNLDHTQLIALVFALIAVQRDDFFFKKKYLPAKKSQPPLYYTTHTHKKKIQFPSLPLLPSHSLTSLLYSHPPTHHHICFIIFFLSFSPLRILPISCLSGCY